MDNWLTDRIKEYFFSPCFNISYKIGTKLQNRLKLNQNIDERALTEDLVDDLDVRSKLNSWGNVINLLEDEGIFVDTMIRKSTKEHKVGADIGFIIRRNIHSNGVHSANDYACLVQCKKIDNDGEIHDFFHTVNSTGTKQSTLMLDITPSSFYFIFVPPSMMNMYLNIEPIGFCSVFPECSSPVYNMGLFHYPDFLRANISNFLSIREINSAASILVIPALAVESHQNKSKGVKLEDILSNCIPLWYWYGRLLIPGFIGDRRRDVINIAFNTKGDKYDNFGVNFTHKTIIGSEKLERNNER